MAFCSPISNPVRGWLGGFFLVRNCLVAPDGRPLHAYHVTQTEFEEIKRILVIHQGDLAISGRSKLWAAVFCLYVAESYRREYDAHEGGWSWSTFERRLGKDIEFTSLQHAAFVADGLAYWKRPIRQCERGRHLLGSLFAEGGLPWLLLQDEGHGFGMAIAAGLKNFYRAEIARRTISDLMADFERYLPKVFQTLETRQLLAGIVEQLMYLAEHFPLQGHADPSSVLDRENPEWRATFPIPLDEDNGRRLMNEWLKDAGKRREERKNAIANATAFTCSHRLWGEPPLWHLTTELILPESAQFDTDLTQLGSTRLELGFFEGERLLARGGAVYAQRTETGLSVRFPRTRIQLERVNHSAPIILRLLDSGRPIHAFHFEGSDVEEDEVPLVFESVDDEWRLAGMASCEVTGDHARVRVPAGFQIEGESIVQLATEDNGGSWLDVRANLRCSKDGDAYAIKLLSGLQATGPLSLKGPLSNYDSSPSVVFSSWPRLYVPEGYPLPRESLKQFINGRALSSVELSDRVGLVHYSVKNLAGETVYRRSFGVLHPGFSVTLYPNPSAHAIVVNHAGLNVAVLNANVECTYSRSDSETTIDLKATSEATPTTLFVRLSRNERPEGIELRLPYPYQGARFVGSDGKFAYPTSLTLEDLLGARIILFSGKSSGQTFELMLELISKSLPHPRRQFLLSVRDAPTTVNLFSYQNDMVQMLGVVNEQDAYIRLTVESSRRLLTIDVRRHNGALRWEADGTFSITTPDKKATLRSAMVSAMDLTAPEQPSVDLVEHQPDEIDSGFFEPLQCMQRNGPWLIYPAKGSSVLFRPSLYLPAIRVTSNERAELSSLREAAAAFNPIHNPYAIDELIAAMGANFNHSSWQYLADLRQHYAHLPLSTFEAWLSLARNPEALASAVFRLELDSSFCERIRDELAVIWECITLPLWADVYARFRDWLGINSLNETFRTNILDNRKAALRQLVSGFEEFGPYLENKNSASLKRMPLRILLPAWYQDLRRTHESNDDWPTIFGTTLAQWMSARQPPLPDEIAKLSVVTFTNAVTYLPIFMAYVTAGQATLDELSDDPVMLKFAVKLISDFDHVSWYTPVHAAVVTHLLKT